MTKAYKVEPRPELHPEAYEYSDGSVRRPGSHGSGAVYVTQPPWSAPTITKENSPSLHQRKAELREREREDYKAEAQRALVAELARGKSLAAAGGVLVGNVARELAASGAVKEHGLKNYTGASDWALRQVDLIKEKVTDNRQVNIENLNLSPDASEHAAMLLARLQERLSSHAGDDSATVIEGDGPKD